MSNSEESLNDNMNIMNVGRQGILDSIDKMESTAITAEIILTLDAYRSALKVSPEHTKNIPNICLTLAQRMSKAWPKHAKPMPNMCPKHTLNKPKTCLTHA